MQTTTHNPRAVALADAVIHARFSSRYGINSHAEYLELITHRATVHLAPALRAAATHAAGSQRSTARVFLSDGKAMIAVPVNDPHQGKTEWATLEYGVWLDVIEMGGDTAWSLDYKGSARRDRQVRCSPPMSRQVSRTKVSVARLIAGARHGQQVRLVDRNPLNLRRDNIHIVGGLVAAGGRVGTAKTDTRKELARLVQVRSSLAGRGLGIPEVA